MIGSAARVPLGIKTVAGVTRNTRVQGLRDMGVRMPGFNHSLELVPMNKGQHPIPLFDPCPLGQVTSGLPATPWSMR